jgi:glycine/D-amino acid oxidase-like deaminating enzyme
MTVTAAPPVVVIGGGSLGLTVAYFLGKAQIPTLLIAPRLSNGVASLAAGAMIDAFGEMDQITHALDRLRLDAKVEAQRYYPQWLEQLEEESGQSILRHQGMFLIGNQQGGNDRQQLQAVRQEMQHYGESFETVDPEGVPGLCPHARYPVYEALFLKGAMTVDSHQLLTAIEGAAHHNGYYRRLEQRVTELRPGHLNGHWHIGTEAGEEITAEAVVVCAGAYSLKVLGESLAQPLPPLYFGLGSGCVVKPTGEPLPHGIRTPNRPLGGGIHLVPRHGQRLYIGANNFFGTDFNQPLGTSLRDIHTLVENAINQVNRTLQDAVLESTHWGLRPVTPSDQPLLGETVHPRLFLATGTHRTGIHYAPIFAQWIVAALQGSPVPQAQPFSPQNIDHLPTPSATLEDGVKALFGSLLLPNGLLPYDGQAGLETFLQVLLQSAFPHWATLPPQQMAQIQRYAQTIPNPKAALVEVFNHLRKLAPDSDVNLDTKS